MLKRAMRKERRKEVTGHTDKPAELPNKEKQAKHRKRASRPHTREPQQPGLMEEGS